MVITNNVPQELNWVEKRSTCTVAEVFNQLRSGFESDVAGMNAAGQLPVNSEFTAEMVQSGLGIAIGQPRKTPNRRVLVIVSDDRIIVREDAKPEWSASVGLNDQGRCILRLEDGTELEQWQFRRRALEGRFFGDRI
jgi:hypothetical protein